MMLQSAAREVRKFLLCRSNADKAVYFSNILILVFILNLLCGCTPQRTATETSAPGHISQAMHNGRSIWVSVEPPLPEAFSDSPGAVAAQFSKWMLPQAGEVLSGSGLATAAQSLTAARQNGSDYLLMITLHKWKSPGLSGIAHEASLSVMVMDVSTEQIIIQSDLNATCYLMAVVSGMSTRDCIYPEVEKWKRYAFESENTSIKKRINTEGN